MEEKIYKIHFDSDDSFIYNGESFLVRESNINDFLAKVKNEIINTPNIVKAIKEECNQTPEEYFEDKHGFDFNYYINEVKIY